MIEVTAAGARRAGALALHGLAGSAAVLLLAVTTPMTDLLPRLRALRVPEPVIEVASLTYQMLFLLLESVRVIRQAQLARLGYAGWRASMRSAGALTAAILVRAVDRARRLADGLAGRGAGHTMVVVVEPRPSSRAFVAWTVLGLAALVAGSLLVASMISNRGGV